MGRQRSPNRDKAFEIYKKQKGHIQLREIANMLNEKEKTISNWKCRDKWDNEIDCSTTKNKSSTTKSSNKKEPIADEIKEVLKNTELTDKQRLFCVIYSRCLNATKAYKKVYKCSYETAMVEGCKALRNHKINEQIEKLNAVQFNKEFIKKSLIQKYLDIAFADISDYVKFGQKEMPFLNPITGEQATDDEGNDVTYTANYVDFKESSEVDGTIISEISKGKDGIKVKLQDKMKAMQWLAEHMGLLTTETQIKLQNEKVKIKIALDGQTRNGKGAGGNIEQLTEAIKQSADTYKKSGEH